MLVVSVIGEQDGYSYVPYPGHQSTTTTNSYAASQSTTANNTNNMTHPSSHNTNNNQGGFAYTSLGTVAGHGAVHNTNQFSYSSLAGNNSQPQTSNSRWGPPPQQYPQQYYQQQPTQYQNQQQQQQYNNQQYTSHAQHTATIDNSLPLPPPPPPPIEHPSNINKLQKTNRDNGQQQGMKEAATCCCQ